MSHPQHRVLVSLDGSTLAERAPREALPLARLPDSEVTLLQVVPQSTSNEDNETLGRNRFVGVVENRSE